MYIQKYVFPLLGGTKQYFNVPVLPPKIGEGVLGLSAGADQTLASAASARTTKRAPRITEAFCCEGDFTTMPRGWHSVDIVRAVCILARFNL